MTFARRLAGDLDVRADAERAFCVTISATMADRSADRHLARQQRTHYLGTCNWCGDLITHAADAPGRKPRFCSPSCKQAAYRINKLLSADSQRQFRSEN